MTTTGERLIQLLQAYGIEIASGIPGTHNIELYRGLPQRKIRHITPRHEQGAGFLADGYARMSGKPALCITISGPGALNITTPMCQALADSVPMLVISADNRTHQLRLGEGRLHETPNLQAVMAECSRWSHTLARPDELPQVLARAFTIFRSERPGPVHLTLPLDVITADADHVSVEAWDTPLPPAPHPDSIERAVEKLNGAESPVIALGGGAVGAASECLALAEKLDAPVTTTHNAKGILPKGHPLHIGNSPSQGAIQDLYEESDVVLAVGTEFGETDYDFFFKEYARMAECLIRIDIDPRQFSRNQRPSVAVLGDSRRSLELLLPELRPRERGAGSERTKVIRKKLSTTRHAGYDSLYETLHDALPNHILIGDSTQPTYYAAFQYDATAPRSFAAASTGYGTLGFALPAALGASLACPDRPVIALAGDGGFQYTLNELSTAVEAKIPVIVLLWHNHSYGEIATNFRNAGMTPIACDIHSPDFVALAHAYGCTSTRVENHDQLKSALKKAEGRTTPTLIELPEVKFL